MGCKGLWAFLESITVNQTLDKLKGKPLCVDLMLYIYKYTIGIRNTGHDILSKNGENLNHIFAIFNLIKNFSDYNILPICIFDGKSPSIKKETIERRKNITENAQEKCKKLIENNDENTYEYIKNFKKSFSINTKIIDECKFLLNIFGIPFIDSVGEADPQCSAISHYYKNFISGVLSEDSDVLIYGTNTLYRNIDFKNNKIKCIELDNVINYLQNKTDEFCRINFKKPLTFTFDNFVDFTIILGNDYSHGIRCSGGNNRDKMFELFVLNDFNIVNFVAHLYQINISLGHIKYYIPENFIEKWVESKNNYNNAEIIDPSTINIIMNKPNITKIKQFFIKKNILTRQINYFVSSLNRLYNLYNLNNTEYNTQPHIIVEDGWQLVVNNKKKQKKLI
jgi:flap endonuclease-1